MKYGLSEFSKEKEKKSHLLAVENSIKTNKKQNNLGQATPSRNISVWELRQVIINSSVLGCCGKSVVESLVTTGNEVHVNKHILALKTMMRLFAARNTL